MSSGNKGNRMKAMYDIVMPKSGGTHEARNAENVNQERLNENFSTLSKEIVKLWDSSENGFDSLAARLTSDEEVFITADDAEDIAVYEIENSAVIAALPTEILTAVSRVYETKSDASDKLDAAKNYTDSELVDYSTTSQTADMISQSVAHKVGDDEIISKINQSAEQIEIQANKVDLSGYVTFTNLSTSGQTTIDGGNITTGTIDASVVTVDNINASNISSGTLSAARIAAGSLAIGKLDSAAQNTINGANSQEQLIYHSKVAGTTSLSGTTTWVTNTTGNQDTWTLKRPTYNSSYPVLFIATQRKDVGGTVTCTTPQIDNTTTVIDGGNIITGTVTANQIAGGTITSTNLATALNNTINTAYSNASDALSNAATAQSTADSANSQEQLIYISKVSGTTTQSATTTWVTNTTGDQNTWTIKRPTYNSSYPVLFVATQRKSVGGTVTCTTPQIDNTTTVIDGGHITTGTIDASVVSVTNLNASNITSGSLSANYIQGGMMTVGGLNNTNGYIRILDSTGNYAGGVGSSGITLQGEEPYSGLSHVIYNAIFPYANSLRDQTTQKQLINVDVQIPSATDEYARYYIQGYDNGTQVSRVEFSSYPYNNGAYLILQGQSGLIRLNSDGTYAGNLTLSSGDLTVYGDATINNNATFKGVLDVVQRRCYADLSQPGWYRAIKFSAINEYDLRGADGSIIDIYLSRIYYYTDNESHKISLLRTYNNNKFVSENSVSNSLGIDKIRLTVHDGGSDDRYAYIDIHYSLTSENPVAVHFNVYSTKFAAGNDYTDKWFAESLQSVDPSPSGETVLTEYTFVENTGTPVSFSPTSGSVHNACWYARIGNVCYLHVDMKDLNPLMNTQIFTLPVGYRPLYPTSIQGQGQESYGALASCIVQTDGNVSIYSQDHYAVIDGNFICQV